MSDNCWKRVRKQTYEKLHKHKTKEDLDVSKPKKEEPRYSVRDENKKTPVVEIPKIILRQLIEGEDVNLKKLSKISHNKKDYKINRIIVTLPIYFHCTDEDGKPVIVSVNSDGHYDFLYFEEEDDSK